MGIAAAKLFDRDLLRLRRERVRDELPKVDFLFQRAAEDMLERLDVMLRDFPVALDLGAGHGLLCPDLLRRKDISRVIAADQSAALLERLATGSKKLRKIICDEEKLPFGEASLNLVMSLHSLHFVNDLPGALIQIRRALKPDGLFMASLTGGQTLFELRQAFMQAEEEIMGGVSPRVSPMADIRDYGGLLQRAGFALPVVDSDLVTVSYDNPLILMRELRMMGAGNMLVDRLQKPLSRALLQCMAEKYTKNHGHKGRINATFEIIHMSGWSPHESQQQPLKPGSAQAPLASAFGSGALPDDDSSPDDEK